MKCSVTVEFDSEIGLVFVLTLMILPFMLASRRFATVHHHCRLLLIIFNRRRIGDSRNQTSNTVDRFLG